MNTRPEPNTQHTSTANGDLLAWLFGVSQLALALGTGLAVLVGG